jgi:hypothetical protein
MDGRSWSIQPLQKRRSCPAHSLGPACTVTPGLLTLSASLQSWAFSNTTLAGLFGAFPNGVRDAVYATGK